MLLKIGQLARQAGLTVRTLHHYDAIGLLRPSGRADNGYRMYNRADIARLHQVQALRRLDLALEDIATVLAGQEADIATLVARQVTQLNAQIDNATLLRDRLLRLQEDFAAQAEPDLQEWLATLALMAIFDKHLTPEETARWRDHRQQRAVEVDAWKTLLADMHALLRDRIPADAPEACAGARRWLALTDPHLKRSPRLMLKIDTLYREDAAVQAALDMDPALIDYVTRAAGHYRLSLYARYLDAAQLDAIRTRYLNQPNGAWLAVSHDLRALMEEEVPADSPQVAAACRRWRGLFDDCFGTDPDIRTRVMQAQATDPDLMQGSSWDPALHAYLHAGLAQLAVTPTAAVGHG
jgi:DNA-binding transcriptional MerR regulator